MAWKVNGETLSMAEGDFGITLPIIVHGATFSPSDDVLITIKDKMNGETIVEKTYSAIENSTVYFEFTETESAELPVGVYAYVIDWYQNGVFRCNIIPNSILRVVDKA